MASSPWMREWNDIIRYVIFPDEELRSLMMLPENTTIITFRDKYFLRATTLTEPLTNETVRILYGNYGTSLAGAPHVLDQRISFEIYVQRKQQHNMDDTPGADRLLSRTELIAERLKELLTAKNDSRLGGYHFRCIGESDMSTNTIGYDRYNVTFQYMKTT